LAQPPIAATFAPSTPPLAPGPSPGWSQSQSARGQKRQAEGELCRERSSPGREADAELFLIENCTAYPRHYVVKKFLDFAKYRPKDWDALVGVFFTHSGVNPLDILWGSIGIQKWERDWVRIDMLEKNGDCLPTWRLPERMEKEGLVHAMVVHPKMLECFMEAMKIVARADNFGDESRLRKVLEIAGLVYSHLRCS